MLTGDQGSQGGHQAEQDGDQAGGEQEDVQPGPGGGGGGEKTEI